MVGPVVFIRDPFFNLHMISLLWFVWGGWLSGLKMFLSNRQHLLYGHNQSGLFHNRIPARNLHKLHCQSFAPIQLSSFQPLFV